MGLLRLIGLGSLPDVVVLDETTLETVAELDVGGHGARVAAGPGAVWALEGRALTRIDPLTRSVTLSARLPSKGRAVAADALGPVVLGDDGLLRVDPATGEVRARAAVADAWDLVAAGGHVWVLRAEGLLPSALSLLRLDAATLVVLGQSPAGQSRYPALLAEDDVVAALVEDPPGSLAHAVFDARTGERLPAARGPASPRGIARHNGHAWRRRGDDRIQRVTADGGTVLAEARIRDLRVTDVVRAHGHLWVTTNRAGNHTPYD